MCSETQQYKSNGKYLKVLFVFCLFALTSACSLEVSLQQALLNNNGPESSNQRKEPDFIHGERVTTAKGHQITGVFGETSEKKKSINNNHWEFEEVFYE